MKTSFEEVTQKDNSKTIVEEMAKTEADYTGEHKEYVPKYSDKLKKSLIVVACILLILGICIITSSGYERACLEKALHATNKYKAQSDMYDSPYSYWDAYDHILDSWDEYIKKDKAKIALYRIGCASCCTLSIVCFGVGGYMIYIDRKGKSNFNNKNSIS